MVMSAAQTPSRRSCGSRDCRAPASPRSPRPSRRLRRLGARAEYSRRRAIRELVPEHRVHQARSRRPRRRAGFLASRLEHHGVTVVCALISPYVEARAACGGCAGGSSRFMSPRRSTNASGATSRDCIGGPGAARSRTSRASTILRGAAGARTHASTRPTCRSRMRPMRHGGARGDARVARPAPRGTFDSGSERSRRARRPLAWRAMRARESWRTRTDVARRPEGDRGPVTAADLAAQAESSAGCAPGSGDSGRLRGVGAPPLEIAPAGGVLAGRSARRHQRVPARKRGVHGQHRADRGRRARAGCRRRAGARAAVLRGPRPGAWALSGARRHGDPLAAAGCRLSRREWWRAGRIPRLHLEHCNRFASASGSGWAAR